MKLYAISWLVVLTIFGICLCDEEYLNDFRELCTILVIPALQNGPDLDNFKTLWNKRLNIVGEKLFSSLDRDAKLKDAEDRCDKLIDSDSICAFRDYAAIGNLVEDDLRKLQETLGSTLESSWCYYFYYIQAWFQHPRIARLNCDPTLKYLWVFMAKLSHLESFNVSFNMKSVYDDINAKGLRQEIDRFCNVLPTENFCLIKIWTNTADKVEKLLAYIGRDQWDKIPSDIRKTALRLHFYAVKSKFLSMHQSSSANGFLSTEDSEVKTWIEEITFYIVSSLQRNQMESLLQVVELLPFSFDLPCDQSAEFPSMKRTICTFSGMLYPLHVSVKNITGNIKHMRLDMDYKTFLTEKRLEQILSVSETTLHTLTQVTQHLKLEMKKSFGEVKKYFQTIANFDFKKAKYDILYITETLNKYKKSSLESGRRMDNYMNQIMEAALYATIADGIEVAIKLTLKIAEACNPMNALINTGNAAKLLEGAQEVARSIASITKAATLYTAFNSLITKVKTFISNLNKNEKYLTSVASLIDSLNTFVSTSQSSSSSSSSSSPSEFQAQTNKFLDDYNNYEPAVSKVDLRELTTYWENLVDRGCEIIASTSGVSANFLQTSFTSKGVCSDAKAEVQKMITSYEETYDFQFELMDALAEAVRSWTSYHAANAINYDFNAATLKSVDNPEIFAELHLLSAFSMVCYKISIRVAIDAYCDFLEYLEGRRPSECVGAGTSITSLLSRTSLKCSSWIDYKDIPTKPSEQGDTAYISLKDLYAGRPVLFKIPDSQWLIDHNWISDEERHDTIFVQQFVIYLPVVTMGVREILVEAVPTVGNQLRTPDGTEYVIFPTPILKYTYREGKQRHVCGTDEDANPYNDGCRDMRQICPVTTDVRDCGSRGHICPSVYTQWNITVHGYKGEQIAVPSTDITLLARLQFCSHYVARPAWRQRNDFNYETSKRFNNIEHIESREDSDPMSDNECCGSNKYYNKLEDTCTECPSGTVSKYKGLFCGRMIRFVPSPTQETTFSFDDAKKMCKRLKSKVASATDKSQAVELGDDSCECGWLSNKQMVAPKPSDSCYGGSTLKCHSNNTRGVYCLNNF